MAKRPFTLNERMTRAIAKKVFGLRIQRLKVRILQGVPARTNRSNWSEIRQKAQKNEKNLESVSWPAVGRLWACAQEAGGFGGASNASNRLWGGCSKIGGGNRFWRFLRPVVAAAAEKPEKLGYRPESNQLLLEAVTALGARRFGSSAGAHRGHGRGFGGFGLVSGDRSQVLLFGFGYFQRCSGSGSYFTESLHSRGGTFAQKSTTKRPAEGDQLFGLFSAFGGGDRPKKGDLLGFIFDGCASRRGGRPELGRLGQVAAALGCFVGPSPVSHGAGAGRRRHKDRRAQGVTGTPVFGGGFVGLASSVSEDNRVFSSGRKSHVCDRNQAAALAGGFFEESIQARSEKGRLAGQPYTARFQAQLYHPRFSGRRGFSNRPKNYTPKPARHLGPVHAPKLGGFLPGGEFNQIERASQSPLRGQLDHKN